MRDYNHWTDEEIERLKELRGNDEPRTVKARRLAKELGKSANTVLAYYYKEAHIDIPDEYALYDGENILAMGTLEEIAEELDIKVKTVRFYGTPASRRRNLDRVLVKLEDEEYEE